MTTLENIFIALCMIALCVMVVIAIAGLIIGFVWAIVSGIKEGRKDGE